MPDVGKGYKNYQLKMDTDDLSEETYNAIIAASEKYNHNLTLQFGLLSYECTNDDNYLVKANELINAWKEDLEYSIAEIFFDVERPSTMEFKNILVSIQNQIDKVIKIPIGKRKFVF